MQQAALSAQRRLYFFNSLPTYSADHSKLHCPSKRYVGFFPLFSSSRPPEIVIAAKMSLILLAFCGFWAITASFSLLTAAEKRHFYPPKLPALRADVTAAGRTRPRGFVLLRRVVDASSISLAPPQAAGLVHSAASPLSTAPAALGFGRIFVPHGGATSGFAASGGYALGCVRKAAQTADTGATG